MDHVLNWQQWDCGGVMVDINTNLLDGLFGWGMTIGFMLETWVNNEIAMSSVSAEVLSSVGFVIKVDSDKDPGHHWTE